MNCKVEVAVAFNGTQRTSGTSCYKVWEGQDRSPEDSCFPSVLLPVCTAEPVSRTQSEVGLVDRLDMGGEVGHGVASHLHGASTTPVSEKHKRTMQGQSQCFWLLGNLMLASESGEGPLNARSGVSGGQKSQQNTLMVQLTDLLCFACKKCVKHIKKQAKFQQTVAAAALSYLVIYCILNANSKLQRTDIRGVYNLP